MTRRDDRWRLPELERLGAQFREAEQAEPTAGGRRHPRRAGFRARRLIVAALGALAAVAAVLEIVSPAGARSPVNDAPVAAERSKSVRFTATQDITLNGRRVTTVAENGELDFSTGAFATRLVVGETNEPIERRRIGTTLYLRQVRHNRERRGAKWSAIRVSGDSLGSFSPPGGYTLIDPQVVFRVMTDAREAITVIGREKVNGSATTHYRLATSLEAFLAAERGQRFTGSPSPAVSATMDVWLDGRGRPVTVRATFLSTSQQRRVVMTTVVNFAAYRSPVVVRAPPSAAIAPTGMGTSPGTLGDPARTIERVLFPAST